MMLWLKTRDGGFMVRSDSGNWNYAYPNSDNAFRARANPKAVARGMAATADKFAAICRMTRQYNARIAANYAAEMAALDAEAQPDLLAIS